MKSVPVSTTMAAAHHFDIKSLLRKITNNITGNKLKEFGRISNINIKADRVQAKPQKGERRMFNAPQQNMNTATDIGNSVEIAKEYQRRRGKAISANCPQTETFLVR